MVLHAEETVQKALISTTSRLVGQYESNGVLLSLAWPDFNRQTTFARMAEGPASRTAIVLSFETVPRKKEFGPLPDYSATVDQICSYMALLYGKRFDSHGFIESNGMFRVPDLTQFTTLINQYIPHNSHSERTDFAVPLDLGEMSRIESLLLSSTISLQMLRMFQGASKFYLQALQSVERDPEIAYLHLITAGEILSNFHKYDADELLDDQCRNAINKIKDGLSDGASVAKLISGRLLQIKRRFVETIVGLVNEDFFQNASSDTGVRCLSADTFRQTVAAAYDLRSRYVHTGISFGRWIAPGGGSLNNEMQLGMPVVEDDDFAKILARAPTYVGLERIIRFSLLNFAKANSFYMAPDDETVSSDGEEST